MFLLIFNYLNPAQKDGKGRKLDFYREIWNLKFLNISPNSQIFQY